MAVYSGGGLKTAAEYFMQQRDFVIQYNAKQMKPTIEKVPLTAAEDKGILEKWGDNIYRINFEVTAPKTSDNIEFVIAPK